MRSSTTLCTIFTVLAVVCLESPVAGDETSFLDQVTLQYETALQQTYDFINRSLTVEPRTTDCDLWRACSISDGLGTLATDALPLAPDREFDNLATSRDHVVCKRTDGKDDTVPDDDVEALCAVTGAQALWQEHLANDDLPGVGWQHFVRKSSASTFVSTYPAVDWSSMPPQAQKKVTHVSQMPR